MIDPQDITGLVLAGGRGSRMGGVDKGLQNHLGMPLALNALLRLSTQVGQVMINANRNLAAYESMGVPVWPDGIADFAGPLAGMLIGLERCETPYLATVPCDTPGFPPDLVARLAQALETEGAELAMAVIEEDGPDAPDGTPGPRRIARQPVFCLLRAELLESLVAFLHGPERKVGAWTAQHRCALVLFDDAAAFRNANTLAELQQLQPPA
jgi:molybdenum cofactor guanylyltransferase